LDIAPVILKVSVTDQSNKNKIPDRLMQIQTK